MTPEQIFLYVLIAGMVSLVLQRYVRRRSIPHYAPAQVEAKLNLEKALLVDVRTEGERRRQYIKGSMHIPLHELERRADELRRHGGDREMIFYCATGNRSVSAALRAKKRGFRVANMQGGIAEWNFRKAP